MTTSPRGYSFENIAFDVSQMNTLYTRLSEAKDAVENIQAVLRNVNDHLEGRGDAITRAKSIAATIATAITNPARRIGRIKSIVRSYGEAAEAHGGKANQLMTTVTEARTALDTRSSELSSARLELHAWMRNSDYIAWRTGEETIASAWTISNRNAGYHNAVTSASSALSRAQEDLADAWTAWENEYESWDEAYGRAVADLASAETRTVSAADAVSLSALANADSPSEVAAAWEKLTAEQKEHLAARYPDFIGNLEGVPYEYRIVANISVLEDAAKNKWGEPTDTEIAKLLTELRENGGVPISLNLFDKNQATAAILYVDGFDYNPNMLVDPLEGVDNINVLVGGMLTELSQIADWSNTARDLNGAVSGDTATIVWFGYDTPNYTTVLNDAQARTGAESLTSALRGLDLAAPGGATTTVIGHSYGSTTAFLAVGSAGDNLGVDRLIAIGSAGLTDRGLGFDQAGGIDYSGTEIFSSTAPEDNWARKGRWWPSDHPIDPGSLDRATSFDSNGGYDPDGDFLLPTPGHGTHDEGDFTIGTEGYPGGYLQDGSESFANIANIIDTGMALTEPGGKGSDDWWLW